MHAADPSEEWLEAVQKIHFPVPIILHSAHKHKDHSSPEPGGAHTELFGGFWAAAVVGQLCNGERCPS